MEHIVVFVTAPDEDTAAGIAKTSVGEGLAACANIVRNIRSIYKWQGKMEDESEVLMIAKTSRDKFEDLAKKVEDMHPYDVPEIISVPITQGSDPYIKWLCEAVSGGSDGESN